MRRFARLVMCLACLVSLGAAAKPLAPADVPEALRPWVGWALFGEERRACPFLYANPDEQRCAWPSRLELNLDDRSGSFTAFWRVDAESWAALPGNAALWPQQVELNGKPAVAIPRGETPAVWLQPGSHRLTGRLIWDRLPESLPIPRDSGIIALSVRGKAIKPAFNEQGELWVQGAQGAGREEIANTLAVRVFRRVIDEIPLRVATRLDLEAAGEPREVLLSGGLLADAIPLALSSPLPARLENDGQLRVLVRPGRWQIELTARLPGEQNRLISPEKTAEPWPGEEIWSFEAHTENRVVEIEGPAAVDPRQTEMPEEWKNLPAFRLQPGETIAFTTLRRGDPDASPDDLSLRRSLWLDFDGGGYTVHDEIAGSLGRNWRLDALPDLEPGRVDIDGTPQLLTLLHDFGSAGVELRRGRLRLSADSRGRGSVTRFSATGWARDFQTVSAELNLPPGWRLFSAVGVDNAPDTWIGHWTLLDLFMALIAALAIARLRGWAGGAVAACALVLLWHEPGAPRIVWLHLVVAVTLLNVLPAGRVSSAAKHYRNLAALSMAFIALPFTVSQVREAIYPQLELGPWASVPMPAGPAPKSTEALEEARLEPADETPMQAAPPPPEADLGTGMPSRSYAPGVSDSPAYPRKRMNEGKAKAEAYGGAETFGETDPDALTQTGPGRPAWRWKTFRLSWNGPVLSGQTINLMLLSPKVNSLLNLLRVALIVALAWILLWNGGRSGRFRTSPKADTGNVGPPSPARPGANPPAAGSAGRPLAKRPENDGAVEGPEEGNGLHGSAASFAGCGSLRSLRGLRALSLMVLCVLFMPGAQADIPDKDLLGELKTRLLAPPECLPACAQISLMQLTLGTDGMSQRLEIHAQAPVAVPLPARQGQWLPDKASVDGAAAEALFRSADGALWLGLKPGRHEVILAGAWPAREQVQLPLPLRPHRVEVEGSGFTVEGIKENGEPEEQLQLTLALPTGESRALTEREALPLPPFLEVRRTLRLGLNWRVSNQVVRISPPNAPTVLEIPLLEGESATTPGLQVKNGRLAVSLAPGQSETSWDSVLEKRASITLRAPATNAWTEVWRVDASPVWHLESEGIPVVRHLDAQNNRMPEWRPWPGETVTLNLYKPKGAPGTTLTLDSSRLRVAPGLRATDASLILVVRSSQGGQHTITLPEGAALQNARIDGAVQPIRQQGRTVTLPIRPGSQSLALSWRQETGIAWRFVCPKADLGAPSVNSFITAELGRDRWVLLTGGPLLGPAVLFWAVLTVLVLAAFGLGRLDWTPLKARHWFLLLLGLSQIELAAAACVVGWLFALGWRGRRGADLDDSRFNLVQLGLALLSLIALLSLFYGVEHGLLGLPDMQVAGNGSSAWMLNWYQDRVDDALPRPWVVSAPLWCYRILMLLWALWLAHSLLDWLRWGWGCCSSGGMWRTRQNAATPAVPPTGWKNE